MKKVVILGDSIRMGYDKYVKEALKDVAEVYYPKDNCKFAQNVLRMAHSWKKDMECSDDVDLVHWNAGHWDVIELYGDEPLSTVEHYSSTVARIHKRLRMLYPNAKIVFAYTTAVLEDQFTGISMRHNSTICRYNEAARSALEGTDAIINDLYAITKDAPREYHSDATHYYTEKATELIGGKVISVICRELGINASDVNIENFEPERYSSDKIGY